MHGIKEQVRDYILDNFLMGLEVGDIQEDTSFLDLGIIDSTGVIELISFLEETYGIHVEDEEMVPENLDSLKNIERYVIQKMALPLVSSA
jgi:acyl carrier protein